MIPNYSTRPLYDKFFAMGVTQYGQMTAGSFCYIGPQGIVHGTTVGKSLDFVKVNDIFLMKKSFEKMCLAAS